jgi:hypothetical protein
MTPPTTPPTTLPGNPQPSLTVLYDGACPLCRREISVYRGLRPLNAETSVCFADVSNADLPLPPGTTREQLLARFHVRGPDGHNLAVFSFWLRDDYQDGTPNTTGTWLVNGWGFPVVTMRGNVDLYGTVDSNGDGIDEVVTVDLQDLKYKEIDFSLLENVNDFAFTLPYSKTEVTFKILTVEDDRKMEEEIKGLKKTTGLDAGTLSTRLKYQLTSVGGDRSIKTVREFIDGGYLLSRDSNELRKYISSLTPDIDTTVSFRLKDGEEITTDMPLGVDFFFPRS